MSKLIYKRPNTINLAVSLVEFLVAIAILAIVLTIAIPQIKKYYRTYKFNQYVSEVESTLKWARMVAMERGIGVSINVEESAIRFHNIGVSLDPNTAGTPLRTISISPSDRNFVKFEAVGFPVGFDSRGLIFGQSEATLFVKRIDTNVCIRFDFKRMSGYINKRTC